MAKGVQAKAEVLQKILEVFPNAFVYDNKEIRIPMQDNGEQVQIKVVLTCAAKLVAQGDEIALPTPAAVQTEEAPKAVSHAVPATAQITEDEKVKVDDLMKQLGL